MSQKEEIQKIFEKNELEDLKRFIKKRESLNKCNMYLSYLFHFVQSSGIFITTIATGYNREEFIWLGVGLNILASLINVYEQLNNNMSKKIMNDIKSIKDNNYVDEGLMVEQDKKDFSQSPLNVPFLDNNKNDSINV